MAAAFGKLEHFEGSVVAKWLAILLGTIIIIYMFTISSLQQDLSLGWTLLGLGNALLSLSFYYYLFRVCLQIARPIGQEAYTKKIKYLFLTVLFIVAITPEVFTHSSSIAGVWQPYFSLLQCSLRT